MHVPLYQEVSWLICQRNLLRLRFRQAVLTTVSASNPSCRKSPTRKKKKKKKNMKQNGFKTLARISSKNTHTTTLLPLQWPTEKLCEELKPTQYPPVGLQKQTCPTLPCLGNLPRKSSPHSAPLQPRPWLACQRPTSRRPPAPSWWAARPRDPSGARSQVGATLRWTCSG